MNKDKELVVMNRVSVGIDHELIVDIHAAIRRYDRIGIIGANGSGKTTLLKTIAGTQDVFSGTMSCKCTIDFVSQIHSTDTWGEQTITEYFSSHEVSYQQGLKFLAEHFTFAPDPLTFMKDLSGGQQSMVVLTSAFLVNPEVLLLDEPTNHLDFGAKNKLVQLIRNYPGAIVCVSHDTWFLEKITTTLWIIDDSHIRLFTGTYADYQQELQHKRESDDRKLEVVKKEERKLRIAKKREDVRAARSKKIGREQVHDRSMVRGALGFFKDNAEKIAGKKKQLFDAKKESIEHKKETLSARQKKTVTASIAGTQSEKTLVRIEDAVLSVFGKDILSNVSFTVRSGDRVALVGKNGSGKSSLVKTLFEIPGFETKPQAWLNKTARFEYLDQNYLLVDPEKTVLQNVIDFSGAQSERIREHLSHFMFHDSIVVEKKAKTLSGGMMARLAFVMITIAPIDLLVLDEPTNNLDIETTSAVAEMLNNYQGALIVITHDMGFLERLNIGAVGITDKTLKLVEVDELNPVAELLEQHL